MSIARLVRRCLPPFALPLVVLVSIPQPAAAQATQEVRSLQHRLTDAKCYAGPLDGVMTPAVTDATRQCPDTAPALTIETGMHLSSIRRIGVDRNCRLAVTGSDDKTVRLWSLPDGKLQRTLRIPIGGGDYGKVFAVAMSPDGKTIAAGGYDAYYQRKHTVGVYLFDAATGALTARLGGFDGLPNHLAFSPDGRTLAATISGGHGPRVLDLKSGAEIAADSDFADYSYGAAFGPDGRLFTTSFDGYLRSYDRSFKLLRKIRTTAGKEPFGVAVDEAGENIAVGFNDSAAVEVYRTSDLGLAYAADSGGLVGGSLSSVAWSRTGGRLIAGGTHGRPSSYPIVVWENGGRGKRSESELAHNTVMALASCGEGFVAATYDPVWARLDANGRVVQSKAGVTVDMRGKRGAGLRVSRDGEQVRFGMEPGFGEPVLFDLAKATLTDNPQGGALTTPKVDGLAVTDWEDNLHPKLGGTSLTVLDYEITHSLAVTPDASGFVLGTAWNLRAFDRSGKQLWQKPGPGAAWGVNVTGDGRLVVAAYGDGTIRWHRISDGQELLALFVDKDDKRWVAWTPSGYYQASPGGEDLFGWHVNRGWDQAADFFPASRFRDRFSRPDIVQRVLVTLDETRAIEQTNREANIRTDSSSVASKLAAGGTDPVTGHR